MISFFAYVILAYLVTDILKILLSKQLQSKLTPKNILKVKKVSCILLIIFGAVIASGINDTGAATSMVNFFIKKFKGKCLELAPALTGFIMSIPVFGDIAIILNAPISAILAKRKKLGMQQVAPFVNLGLTLTHGLVPPTPGILAVSILLGADIGTVIIIGLICSVISFVVCYLGLRPVYAKGEYVAPLPQYTEGIEAVEDTNDVNALLIKEDNTPSAGGGVAVVGVTSTSTDSKKRPMRRTWVLMRANWLA